MKKIILFGASGFIGSRLIQSLADYEVKAVKSSLVYKLSREELSSEIEGYDVIINLAGASIFSLWTKAQKKKIYSSRVHFTERIKNALEVCSNPPERFLSASAVGIYKGETEVDENSRQYADNFLAKTVQDWEKVSFSMENEGISVTAMRFGIVMGRGGGAYRILSFLTKYNLGGYFGKGDQHISFIYIGDLVRAIKYILDANIKGIVNITAPEVTDYKEFVNALKREYNSFIIWPVPEAIPRGLLGENSVLYLEGQIVRSGVLTKNNFKFEASDIYECIDKIEAS